MEHYRMYAEVFGLDVPLTQSQPTESTQGTHRTPSAPRSPTPKKDTAESSATKQSTMIHFRLPERRSTRLTPPVLVPTIEKVDKMILQDTLQLSLAEHKSREEQEARENVELVNKHLASEEIEKLVEGSKNVIDDSLPPRIDKPQIPGTRLEPRSDKESPEVERTNDEEKGKIVEESRSTPLPTPIRSPRTHTNLVSLNTNKLQELMVTYTQTTSLSRSQHTKLSRANRLLSLFKAKPVQFKRYKNFFQELQGRYTYLFEHLKENFLSRKSFDTLADHLQEVMVESLPTMVDTHIKEQVKKQVPKQVPQTTCRPSAVRPRDQDDPHDDAHLEGENSNQEQEDYYDFLTDSYASDDDEIPSKQVSQDIMEEVSLTVDEAKLKKMADEMLRQRCTSGDEHQYHINQMKNFLQSDIVWESRKEILVSPYPRKTTPLVQSCQRIPEAPTLSLINQDLLYMKKGSSGPEKIVNKSVKKFNPYARYGVEHWKNPHAKIFYIRKQKELEKSKEEVYSNSKIIQVIKTYWELGHEHKFITKIVAKRANECIVSITEPDYKNLNKNDIEEMYLLIMNGKKVNLTAPTISFPGVEKHRMFFIIYEPVHGIIYKNNKKEKRVMRHSEIHKFCDATLNRVLEGLKSYNNDVKYGYVQRELTNDEVEYMKLFEEEI
ncbi:hypothetical protein Tco_0720694 [Tanacetum coccineum]